MYENITLDSIAHMGTYEEFVKMYKEGEQYKKRYYRGYIIMDSIM